MKKLLFVAAGRSFGMKSWGSHRWGS